MNLGAVLQQSLDRIDNAILELARGAVSRTLFRIERLAWKDVTICLAGYKYVRCRFEHCRLIVNGPYEMKNCFLEDCTIEEIPDIFENVVHLDLL
jgi:hypothetical protein